MDVLKTRVFRKAKRWLTAAEHWRIFRLKRYGIQPELFLSLSRPWFRQMDIGTVFDIGAHIGAWARTVHELLPGAWIYSFEPIPESYGALCRLMNEVSTFRGFNVALGDGDRVVQFNRNDFAPSSSLLPMAEVLKQAYPYTAASRAINVNMQRLDAILPQIHIAGNLLIKMDVQGFENQVIAGGHEAFSRAKIVITEVSFEPLYEGQPLFGSIHRILEGFGFRYIGTLAQDDSPTDGRPLFADAIFVRDNPQ